MTAREMQIEFDRRVQLAVPMAEIAIKPDSGTIFMFLNEGQDTFIKSKYTGYSADRVSFEQTQKIIEELRPLVVEATIIPTEGEVTDKPNSYIAELPANYKYLLSDEVTINGDTFNESGIGSFTQRVGVIDCTADNYRSYIDNPYSEHRYHYETAKPLRLNSDDKVELITDGTYEVTHYYLRYLKEPLTIALGGSNDCELPNDTHQDIVKLAVSLYLTNISSQTNNQNQS